MKFQELLESNGYTRELRHLCLLINERDRFEKMLADIAPIKIENGQRALDALNLSIESSEAALAAKYDRAVRTFNRGRMSFTGLHSETA